MMKRWTENQTNQFVKIYLKHDSLWDPRDDDYRLRDKRIKAHREIIAEFKAKTGIVIDEGQLKIKLKSLKSTYTQEKCKIKQRSNSEWTYKPNMKWFYDWHRCMTKRHAAGEAETSHDSLEESTNLDPSQKIWLPQNDENDSEDDTSSHQDDDYLLVLKSDHDTLQDTTKPSPYESKKKKISDNTFRGSISPSEVNKDSRSIKRKEDEFDVYGKYIASQLRKIDLQKALKVKLQIHKLVSEARMSEIEDLESLNGI